MSETTAQNYQELLSHALQKQIIILGRQIALMKARHVVGLTIDDHGVVTTMTGEPKQLVTQFLQEFRELSSPLVEKTMQPLIQVVTEAPVPTDAPAPAGGLEIKPLAAIGLAPDHISQGEHETKPEAQAAVPQEHSNEPQPQASASQEQHASEQHEAPERKEENPAQPAGQQHQ